MFNNWIKQSEEKFCLMEISRSNEVKYLKIGPTRALNCIAAVGGKKRQNKLPQTCVMLTYVYMQ